MNMLFYSSRTDGIDSLTSAFLSFSHRSGFAGLYAEPRRFTRSRIRAPADIPLHWDIIRGTP